MLGGPVIVKFAAEPEDSAPYDWVAVFGA